jgi:hypothetical protein
MNLTISVTDLRVLLKVGRFPEPSGAEATSFRPGELLPPSQSRDKLCLLAAKD